MSLRLSKKMATDTGYDGLVVTLRQESPGHLTGFLIHTVPPTLSEIGIKRKVPSSYNCATWTHSHTEQYRESEEFETGVVFSSINVKVFSGSQTAVQEPRRGQ